MLKYLVAFCFLATLALSDSSFAEPHHHPHRTPWPTPTPRPPTPWDDLPDCETSAKYLKVHREAVILVDYRTIKSFDETLRKRLDDALNTKWLARGKDGNAFFMSLSGSLKDDFVKAIGITSENKLFIRSAGTPSKLFTVGSADIKVLGIGVSIADGPVEGTYMPVLDTVTYTVGPTGTMENGIAAIAPTNPLIEPLQSVNFKKANALWPDSVLGRIIKIPTGTAANYENAKFDGVEFIKVAPGAPSEVGYFLKTNSKIYSFINFYDSSGAGDAYTRPLTALSYEKMAPPLRALISVGVTGDYDSGKIILLHDDDSVECFRNRSPFVD